MKIKILFKIISITILLIMLFPYITIVIAAPAANPASVEEVGNAIGAYALDYYNKVQEGTAIPIHHPWASPSTYRSQLYEVRRYGADGSLPPTKTINGKQNYVLDCVGWVNFCIYNVTGFSKETVSQYSGCYVAPPGEGKALNTNRAYMDVEKIGPSELSAFQTGDIAITQTHVMVFVNDNGTPTFIHSNGPNGPKSQSYEQLSPKYQKFIGRARIKDSVAKEIDKGSLIYNASLAGSISGGVATNIELSEFYYNGVPDGRYSVADSFWMILIDALKDIFTFLVNILFYIFRMVFVGFTAIAELLLTYIIESIAGKSNLRIDTTTPESSGNVTVESIIFNRINIFDVNFFKDPAAAATP